MGKKCCFNLSQLHESALLFWTKCYVNSLLLYYSSFKLGACLTSCMPSASARLHPFEGGHLMGVIIGGLVRVIVSIGYYLLLYS